MYHPYFRGKQFELLAIRETANLLAASKFVPIIEPVRETLKGLERTLDAVSEAGGQAIVVVNPRHGDHRDDGEDISALLERDYGQNDAISAGILLTSSTTNAVDLIRRHADQAESLIHAGFTDARTVSECIADRMSEIKNIFIEDQANMLYRRHFAASQRVLIRDAFERKRNADYAPVDNFSDLHATYPDMGMDGYGDFLTIGDQYSEGGGPAYAVAIHLTFIDPDQDNSMFVYHFVSDTNDTPTDPAGKFAQALAKLIATLNGGNSKLYESSAVAEFRLLNYRGHFPGLGHIKKLSIKHHLETLAAFHAAELDG